MINPILSVKNVEKSITFYKEKLGFTVDFTMPDQNGVNTFAFVRLADNAIGLSQELVEGKAGVGVVFMIYVADDTDIDAYYEQVKSNGATIAQKIRDEYWGDRSFAVTDLDGYFLSFSKTVKDMSPEEIIAAQASP